MTNLRIERSYEQLRIERSYEQLTKVLKGLHSDEAEKMASFDYIAGLVGALGWIRGGPNKVLDALLEETD